MTNDISMYTKDEQFYFNFHHTRYIKTISLIKQYCQNGTVLDVGAYPFQLTHLVQRDNNYIVIGLDTDPKRKQELIKKLNLNIKKCDIERELFPINSNSVDVVLFCETFEHLGYNPLFALQEINRVLTKNGHLILTTPNLYSLKNILSFCIGRGIGNPYGEYQKMAKYGHMGHIREYSRHELKNLLINTNFKIVATYFEQYSIPTSSKIRSLLLSIILFFLPFLKSSQTVICQKK